MLRREERFGVRFVLFVHNSLTSVEGSVPSLDLFRR